MHSCYASDLSIHDMERRERGYRERAEQEEEKKEEAESGGELCSLERSGSGIPADRSKDIGWQTGQRKKGCLMYGFLLPAIVVFRLVFIIRYYLFSGSFSFCSNSCCTQAEENRTDERSHYHSHRQKSVSRFSKSSSCFK